MQQPAQKQSESTQLVSIRLEFYKYRYRFAIPPMITTSHRSFSRQGSISTAIVSKRPGVCDTPLSGEILGMVLVTKPALRPSRSLLQKYWPGWNATSSLSTGLRWNADYFCLFLIRNVDFDDGIVVQNRL
jgi:hypothetical protein